MAAGTVTYTETTFGSVKRIKAAWTSDASGNVSGTTTSFSYDGALILAQTAPGVATPTTYTITLKDADGNDLLCGAGTTRSTSATEYLKAPQGAVATSTLELGIASAGNAKNGVAYFWIR